MNLEPQVLIVDDDPNFVDMYESILRDQGFLVATATDCPSALNRLSHGRWLAVLLDQKLQGTSGPDTGLDMLEEIQTTCPEAKVIVISGYATSESVTRALAAGAFDFIEKGDALEVILPAKLRHILNLYRAQEQANLTRRALQQLLNQARDERDTNRKGKLFEDFVAALFRSIPELGPVIDVRKRNDIEEFDLIILNTAERAPWKQEGAYILVECKNWSGRVGRPEYDAFHGKLRRRGRCTIGLLLAPGGFTDAFHEATRREPSRDLHVLPLDLRAIVDLIDAPDRLEELSKRHYHAIVDPGAK